MHQIRQGTMTPNDRTLCSPIFPRRLSLLYLLLVILSLVLGDTSKDKELQVSQVQNISINEGTGLCSIVKATNIGSQLSEWRCSSIMQPVTDPCVTSWRGLNCTLSYSPLIASTVNRLALNSQKLEGTIPHEISFLQNLTSLNFQNNSFSSTLPPQLGALGRLSSYVASINFLTGSIPSEYGNLLSLREFSVRDNSMNGSIPSQLGRLVNLRSIFVYNNYLTGTIPSTLGSLVGLTTFQFYNNSFSGPLPSELGNLATLRNFNVRDNRLKGRLPTELARMTSLISFRVNGNDLTGSIPSQLSAMTLLNAFFVNTNYLTGSIPSQLSAMTLMDSFFVNNNYLNGSIPSQLSAMTRLRRFRMQRCLFTGTIPSQLSRLTLLQDMYLANNKFNGTVPAALGSLTFLQQLDLSNNSFTGAIPSDIGNMVALTYIDVQLNRFNGVLPPAISKLSNLTYFSCSSNSVHGSIPESYSTLAKLYFFSVFDNSLTGSLPESLSSWNKSMQLLYLSSNSFSGNIPSYLGTYTRLSSLFLQTNSFGGTIPFSILGMTNLQIFYASENNIRGSLSNIFKYYSPNRSLLSSFDVSSNRITGSIPGHIFVNSSIKVFGVGKNCLHGTIPESMCSARKLQSVLLHSLSSCSSFDDNLFLTGYFKKTIGGRIPACIFQLPSIESIYLAANALQGTIPDDILVSSPHLVNLSISHNLMSGTIPPQLLHSKFIILDVSNNKLTGTLEDGITDYRYDMNDENIKTTMLFTLNRFSGKSPGATAQSYDTVSVVKGNQFSCDDISKIKSVDSYAAIQLCGSNNLNLSIYLLIFLIVIALILVFFITRATREKITPRESLDSQNFIVQIIERILQKFNDWSERYSELINIENKEVASIVACIRFMKYIGLCLTALIIFLSCIVYPSLKENFEYRLIHIQYNWLVSGAFMRGLVPSILMYLIWLIVVLFAAIHISSFCRLRSKLIDSNDLRESHNSCRDKSLPQLSILRRFLVYSKKFYSLGAKLVFLDLIVALGVNVAFVSSLLDIEDQFVGDVVRFVFAALKLFLDMVPGTLIVKYYIERGNKTYVEGGRLKLLCLLLNGIICPIIATFFFVNRCFRKAIEGLDPIKMSREVLFCSDEFFLNGATSATCLSYTTVVQESQFTPPFLYSNQCMSAFQVHFIPLTIIGVIMKAVVYPIYFLNIKDILYVKDKILHPGTFKDSAVDKDLLEGHYFLKNRFLTFLLVSQMQNITLLLSLGLLSPPLAAAIGLAIISETYFAEMKIGKQLMKMKSGELVLDDNRMKFISNLWVFPKKCFGTVLSVSSFIISFGVFDMSSDELGFTAGVLMIVLTLATAFAIWFLVRKTEVLSVYYDRLFLLDVSMRKSSVSISSFFYRKNTSNDVGRVFSQNIRRISNLELQDKRSSIFSRESLVVENIPLNSGITSTVDDEVAESNKGAEEDAVVEDAIVANPLQQNDDADRGV